MSRDTTRRRNVITAPRSTASGRRAATAPPRPASGQASPRPGPRAPPSAPPTAAAAGPASGGWRARKSLGVVAMHPVPQRLALHAAALRRPRPVHPIQHQGDRQHPPRRPPVLRLPRRRPQLRRRHVVPRDLNGHPCRLAIEGIESKFRRLGNPHESARRAVGIS